MDLQTLLDERDIRQAHYRYAVAHDTRNWEILRTVFAPDVIATYGPDIHLHGPDAMMKNSGNHLNGCGPSQHMMTNFTIEVTGDTAQSRCYIRAFHQGRGAKSNLTFDSYGQYESSWRRTKEGWRAFTWTMKIFTNIGDFSVLGPG